MTPAASRPAWPAALLGPSATARRLRDTFTRATRPESRALIVAVPGIDAAAIARAIHARATGASALVVIDCAAMQPSEVEAALLGRRSRRRPDSVEHVDPGAALAVARRGTCILLAIDELSGSAQARLARALRDGEVCVGGGSPTALRLRIVASASATLDADVARGHFRADLKRRLGALRLDLGPLGERREDVPEIVAGLMAEAAAARGVPPRPLAHAALALIAALQWPDNMAGLSRLVESLAANGPAPVRVEEVLACLGAPGHSAFGPHVSLREARRQFEREYIAATLRRFDGRIAAAARALGIQRTNLYRKARQLGLHGSGRAG